MSGAVKTLDNFLQKKTVDANWNQTEPTKWESGKYTITRVSRGGGQFIYELRTEGTYAPKVFSLLEDAKRYVNSQTIDGNHLRAPKGGVSIQGKDYAGGQFIPNPHAANPNSKEYKQFQEEAEKAIAAKEAENTKESSTTSEEKQAPSSEKVIKEKAVKESPEENAMENWNPARANTVSRADALVEQGRVKPEVRDAVKRIYDELIPRLGVNIDSISFENERMIVDPSTKEGEEQARKLGVPEKEIEDAKRSGNKFQAFGSHQLLSGSDGEGRSAIKIFPDASAEDVYHEFAHAIERQGGIPNWEGSEEDHARYLAKVLAGENEESITEFTSEGSRKGEATASTDPKADSTILYSLQSWEETDQAKLHKDLIDSGIDKATADKWIADVNNVSKIVLDHKDLLDFKRNPDMSVSSLKSNSDHFYRKSLDFSTICKKSSKMLATIGETQKLLGRPLTAAEWMAVRQEMKDQGETVSCLMCYVFSRKMQAGASLAKMEKFYPEIPQDILNDVQRYSELKKFKTTKAQAEAIAKEANETSASRPSGQKASKEMTAEAALKKYPTAYSWLKGRGAGAGKFFEARTDYRRELLDLTPKEVASMNNVSGMRTQSWSDFEAVHLLDKMQSTIDAAYKKLSIHAYTKMPEYADVACPTGEMVNLSLVAKGSGLDDKGNLVFDDVEGMPSETAFQKREQNVRNKLKDK